MYIDEDDEMEISDECVFTVNDLKSLAKNYINIFFKDISFNGQRFGIDKLHTHRNVSMVLNLNICEGMPIIYEAIEYSKKQIKDDIEFVMTELRRCSKLGLPKCFAAGMLGVYLEMCMGCKLDYKE